MPDVDKDERRFNGAKVFADSGFADVPPTLRVDHAAVACERLERKDCDELARVGIHKSLPSAGANRIRFNGCVSAGKGLGTRH